MELFYINYHVLFRDGESACIRYSEFSVGGYRKFRITIIAWTQIFCCFTICYLSSGVTHQACALVDLFRSSVSVMFVFLAVV